MCASGFLVLFVDLRSLGIAAAVYHAGLTPKKRETSHEAFIRDDIQCIVATVAFGMGIDKPVGTPPAFADYRIIDLMFENFLIFIYLNFSCDCRTFAKLFTTVSRKVLKRTTNRPDARVRLLLQKTKCVERVRFDLYRARWCALVM